MITKIRPVVLRCNRKVAGLSCQKNRQEQLVLGGCLSMGLKELRDIGGEFSSNIGSYWAELWIGLRVFFGLVFAAAEAEIF